MIEFRWVVFLTLWTLLIGPVVDFTNVPTTGQPTHAKTTSTKSTKTSRF